jgi:hypothetical protein
VTVERQTPDDPGDDLGHLGALSGVTGSPWEGATRGCRSGWRLMGESIP